MNQFNTKQWLQTQFDSGLSQREIAAMAKVTPVTIRAWFKKHDIKPRTISEALQLKPSRHEWTQTEKDAHAAKMRAVQSGRAAELTAAAKLNWERNRTALTAGIKAAANTPERRAQSRAIAKQNWASPACRAKLLKSLRSLRANPDFVVKHKLATQLATNSEAFRAKVRSFWQDADYRQLNLDRLLSPDVRAKALAKYKELLVDPEYQKWRSALSKRLWENAEYRSKQAVALAAQPKTSSQQLLLYDILDDLGVTYYREGVGTILAWYVFDCLVVSPTGKKILIEVQGDYWHNREAQVTRDKQKFSYIERYFPDYELIYVWEHEFKTIGGVAGRLRNLLGLTQPDLVEFRLADVVVQAIEWDAARDFITRHHYSGRLRSGTSYGATLGGQLVAVATISKPVRQNLTVALGEHVDLAKFCIHPQYQKKNFASWFLGRLTKLLRGAGHKRLVAYADTTVGHRGTIYRAANFVFHHEVPSDYWYVNRDGYVMLKKTLYNHAVSLGQTENEFAAGHGYEKRWGGKKLCFVKDL